MMQNDKKLLELLAFIYGSDAAPDILGRIKKLLDGVEKGRGQSTLDEKDALLISYGDMLAAPAVPAASSRSALMRLHDFLADWNKDAFSFVHILPFHPYTSDDGFSVVDYRKVDPRLGSWEDIQKIGTKAKLVFDFVINHGSVSSPWFKAFLRKEEPYKDWYITRPGNYDYSSVTRPRTHPLLTPFVCSDGSTVHVWTTFSADQVDYDFSNPDVLIEFMRILLEFAHKGARIIRLDAIAYLWKEDGSSCIHHPKTHAVVKLFRALIDRMQLDLLLLTETNVPHEQNISYFGDGDEAHMVYNFALPPLVLHAAISGDAGPLRRWAAGLSSLTQNFLFLNFLASHDGVGLTPAKGLIDDNDFEQTLETAKERGALVSYKAVPGGSVPYELNCSYLSVVSPASCRDPLERARPFLCCHAVLLALSGLPAVYFHSWVGSEHWQDGPAKLGYNRAINREKIPVDKLEAELYDNATLRHAVYTGMDTLLRFRRSEPAFAPAVAQKLLPVETDNLEKSGLFVLLRGPDTSGRSVLCIQNLSAEPKPFTLSVPGLSDYELPDTIAAWEVRWLAFGADSELRQLTL